MLRRVAELPAAIQQHLGVRATRGLRLPKTFLPRHVATLPVESRRPLQEGELRDGRPDSRPASLLRPSNIPRQTLRRRRMLPRLSTPCVRRRQRSHRRGLNHHLRLLAPRQEGNVPKRHLAQGKRAKLADRPPTRVTIHTETRSRITTTSARSSDRRCRIL